MATAKQLPPVLDLEGVAGCPLTVRVTTTGGHSISSPEIVLRTGAGATSTVLPAVELDGDVITFAWSAEDTAALNTGTRVAADFRWSLQALVDGDGPHQLVARSLVIHPVGSADVSTELDFVLAVDVGGVNVALTVELTGNPVWGSYLFTEDAHALTTEAGDLLVDG